MFNAEVLIRRSQKAGTTIQFKRHIVPEFYASIGNDGVIAHLEQFAKNKARRNRLPIRFWSIITFVMEDDQGQETKISKAGYLTYKRM